MFSMSRLQLHILQDEIRENFDRVAKYWQSITPRKHNKVAILSNETQDSEGRVWVEVGVSKNGLRLRVAHLHPGNPTVNKSLKKNVLEPDENLDFIALPEDDEISLASLEDYWFNHWQGPHITADNNQNNYSLRYSKRNFLNRSRHKFRCSTCQKKIKNVEIPPGDMETVDPHEEGANSSGRPSKIEESVALDEDIKPCNEDALSRYSASDELLARANRILDNEMRTSFTLFNDGTVEHDVLDGTYASMEGAVSPDSSGMTPLPPSSPRQCRSCPCSPKLSMRNQSPESTAHSPKSNSYLGISKFSLSNSLLALHRQASNTLRPDFLKSDLGRSEYVSNSKNSSQHNSLKSNSHKSHKPLNDSNHESIKEQFQNKNNEYSEAKKTVVQETQSLPTLKLSKRSLVYKAGALMYKDQETLIESQNADNDKKLNSDDNKTANESEGACALSSEVERSDSGHTLPDVVPKCETSSLTESSFTYDMKNGVINLGFDGHDESSDFTDNLNVKTVGNSPKQKDKSPSSSTIEDICKEREENYDIPSTSTKRVEAIEETSSPLDPINPTQDNRSPELNPQLLDNPDVPIDSPLVNPPPVIIPDDFDRDPMDYARNMVYWWKGIPKEEENEFCLQQAECKVKQKPLLFFLHGIGGCSDMWKQQLWYFVACGYEVVAPDLLGHGLSSAPDVSSNYSFSSMLDYITLVFDLFVPPNRKCVVIGHGYGCALAAALARGRPLNVRLVIMASCGGPSPLIPNPPGSSTLRSIIGLILKPFISLGCGSREFLYTPRGKHFSSQLVTGANITPTPTYVISNIVQGQDWPEGDVTFHRRITVPTLLLYGMKDTKVPLVEMCEMERAIPRAFLEVIPGAGHDLMLDAALDVCHSIHRFVKRWKHQV